MQSNSETEQYYSDIVATFGDRVAAARQKSGFTQDQLANQLGVNKTSIAGWEDDLTEPRANMVLRLCGVLGISIRWLLSGEGNGISGPQEQQLPSINPPFHLAFGVTNLADTKWFYKDILGCELGRSTDTWQDINFFGHQVSAHVIPLTEQHERAIDGIMVPIPHFGVVLSWPEWEAMAERILCANIEFLLEPQIRFKEQPAEQGTFFVCDPSNNTLEFKTFRDFSIAFSA